MRPAIRTGTIPASWITTVGGPREISAGSDKGCRVSGRKSAGPTGCLLVIVVVVLLALVPKVGGALAVVALLGGSVAWLVQRQRQPSAPAAADRPAVGGAETIPAEPPAARRREHVAPRPTGTPVPAWVPGGGELVEVVGEFAREVEIRRAFRRARLDIEDGDELVAPALLVDDHENPHDSNAVAVWIAGEHVGYLDRDTARIWTATVRERASVGEVIEVEGWLWASERPDGSVGARATVRLPYAGALSPLGGLPDVPHVVLPGGGRVQVTKEVDHMDVLGPLAGSGGRVPVAATLHAVVEVRARSTAEVVEVRYRGQRVGVLSAGMSQEMLPLVRYVEARGLTPVARADVSGSSLKAEVTLFVVRSGQVDEGWLQHLGPEVAGGDVQEVPRGTDGSATS